MSNTINLVTNFQPLLDEVYKAASLTGDLENGAVKFDGSKTVKVLKLTVPALGAYTRNTGYTAGDVTADWEPFTLTQDRGTEFSVDAMDNEETLNMTFGNASSEFIRRSVVPQVDAYRFAKMVQENGITRKQATLTTGDEVIAAINAAMTAMDEDEVTAEGRILYITPTEYGLIQALESYKSKACMDRFAKVIQVPGTRFYTNVTVNNNGYSASSAVTDSFTGDGSEKVFTLTAPHKPAYIDKVTVDGTANSKYTYDPATGKITFATAPANTKAIAVSYNEGLPLNFMIVDPKAVFAVAKHKKLRVFDPDTNQKRDDYLFQYRLYHDMFVYPQKAAGVYAHFAAKA